MAHRDRQVLFLSDKAVEGFMTLAKEFNFQGHGSISRMLTAFAGDNTNFLDARPQQFKAADNPHYPRIWNTGDPHQRRDLGAIPLDYLAHLAEVHDIAPFRHQARAIAGLMTPYQKARWFFLSHHPKSAIASPVAEAIGLAWLIPASFPTIDSRLLKLRANRVKRANRTETWIGV